MCLCGWEWALMEQTARNWWRNSEDNGYTTAAISADIDPLFNSGLLCYGDYVVFHPGLAIINGIIKLSLATQSSSRELAM